MSRDLNQLKALAEAMGRDVSRGQYYCSKAVDFLPGMFVDGLLFNPDINKRQAFEVHEWLLNQDEFPDVFFNYEDVGLFSVAHVDYERNGMYVPCCLPLQEAITSAALEFINSGSAKE